MRGRPVAKTLTTGPGGVGHGYPSNDRCWEHEIFYKKLKINLRGGSVLHSHRPETSAQEVAALLIACSLIAQERSEIAAPATFNR